MRLNRHYGVMHLEKYHAAVLELMFERTAIAKTANTFRFALSGDFDGEFSAAAARAGYDGEYIALNLPTYSASVFIALTDKDPESVVRLLANLEDYERENGLQLGLGEAVVVPDISAQFAAPFAVLLLRTASLSDIADVPDRADIAGRPTAFFLAVPLTKTEYDFRTAHGHDLLLDEFEKQGKSLVF
jgi:hypothetical protein